MDKIGFSSMNAAASNRANPMRDLSKMIGISTTPNRNEELHTADGYRKSTFGKKISPRNYKDWESDQGYAIEHNKRSPDKTRPTSEERKINRPMTKHYFTLDRQEKKRAK